MNEQKKVTLPGSISNIPTTNYGRAYAIVSTWAHRYTADEMKRLLVGRGVDINDIDVDVMHKACLQSSEGLGKGDGATECLFTSNATLPPKTPEQHTSEWTERKRGLIIAALARHRENPDAILEVEKITEKFIGPDSNYISEAEAMGQLMHLLGANTLEPDAGWLKYLDELGISDKEATKRHVTPIRWQGESELSRLELSPSFPPGYLKDLYARLDAAAGAREIHVSTPSSNAEDMLGLMFNRSMQRYGHTFRTQVAEVTLAALAAGKAKRFKNQRRRRNAKARRKTK